MLGGRQVHGRKESVRWRRLLDGGCAQFYMQKEEERQGKRYDRKQKVCVKEAKMQKG